MNEQFELPLELLSPINFKISSTVKWSNDIIRSRMRFKYYISGQILAAISSGVPIDKNKIDPEKIFTRSINISELDFSGNGGSIYEQLDKACDELSQFKVDIKTRDLENGDLGFIKANLFSVIIYHKGIITGRIDPVMVPFFWKINDRFTLFPRREYNMLKGTYAQQLFTLIMQIRNMGGEDIKLEDLHVYLDSCPTFVKEYKEFRRRVLLPATKEIMAKTNLRFEWEPLKECKKITAIRFKNIHLVDEYGEVITISKVNYSELRKKNLKTMTSLGTNKSLADALINMQDQVGMSDEEMTSLMDDICKSYKKLPITKQNGLGAYLYIALKNDFMRRLR